MNALVEREGALAELRAAVGRGRVVLLAGEAGIGKTSVLRALAQGHAASPTLPGPVWWGACDALDTPHPLAPLLDMAREAAPPFAAALAGPRPALFEAVLEALRSAPRPVLMVVEDAHWADEATLDLLKFLGRRMTRTRALLVVSYRDDEVTASHPLRRVIGELPPDALTRVPLARLTPAGVQQLAQQMGCRADGVHALTRGNAFFATEVLRDTAEPRGPVPATVQDVVLARFARLTPRVQALLRAMAVMPGRAERGLVDLLVAPTLADIEAAMASGLVVAEGDSLAFRHELARVAVEAALPAPAAQDLHRRLLATLEAPGRGAAPARCVHHAVQAHDRAAIGRHAPGAAREAAARAAHREAAAHWHLAVHQASPADAAERVQWLEQHAAICALVGRTDDAMVSRLTLERLARERGDTAAESLQLAQRASLHIARMQHDVADALTQRALDLLAPLTPGPTHALVWRWSAHLRMLNRDCVEAVHWARRAADLAAQLGDEAAEVEALATLGTASLFIDFPQAVAWMLQARERHVLAGRATGAMQIHSNLGSGAGELMQLRQAEPWLQEALAQCVANEFDSAAHYLRSWLALVALYRGRWDEAGQWAEQVLRREGASSMSRLMALLAVARLRLRRGDPGVEAALAEGLTLTGEQNTLQRTAPLRAVRAEAALAAGDKTRAAAEVATALPLALAKGHPWFIGELAYLGWQAGTVAQAPPGAAEPFALQISGRWREAAAAWQAIDAPFEQARALAEGDSAAQQAALVLFDGLGARPAAEALRRRLRDAGVRGVQRGVRASTRRHPCGLTSAEMAVLTLMARGLRNAEIAGHQHRSVRTVDHHVAAVLAKLAVESRLEAVRRAEREGWLAPPAAPSGQSG
jgi:DNA-binding CsgD family transcriptional regulator